MHTNKRPDLRLGTVVVLASILAGLAGCSTGSPGTESVGGVPAASSAGQVPGVRQSAEAVKVRIRFGDQVAVGTLAGTRAADGFTKLLPLRLDLADPWGQAKAGALPVDLDIPETDAVIAPQVGGIYYWPPGHGLVIYYDDLGHTVPPPGLAPLGTIDSGLAELAAAGNHVAVRVELLQQSGE